MKPSEFDFRGLREKLGNLTQDQIAAILKVSPATLRRWETDSQYAKYTGLREKGDLTPDEIAVILKVSPATRRRWEKMGRDPKEGGKEQPLKRHYESTLRQLQSIAEDNSIDKVKAREMLLDPYRFLATAGAIASVSVATESEPETSTVPSKDSMPPNETKGEQAPPSAAQVGATISPGIAASVAALVAIAGGPLGGIIGSVAGGMIYNILKKKEGK